MSKSYRLVLGLFAVFCLSGDSLAVKDCGALAARLDAANVRVATSSAIEIVVEQTVRENPRTHTTTPAVLTTYIGAAWTHNPQDTALRRWKYANGDVEWFVAATHRYLFVGVDGSGRVISWGTWASGGTADDLCNTLGDMGAEAVSSSTDAVNPTDNVCHEEFVFIHPDGAVCAVSLTGPDVCVFR